jgi:hypothetical protein
LIYIRTLSFGPLPMAHAIVAATPKCRKLEKSPGTRGLEQRR